MKIMCVNDSAHSVQLEIYVVRVCCGSSCAQNTVLYFVFLLVVVYCLVVSFFILVLLVLLLFFFYLFLSLAYKMQNTNVTGGTDAVVTFAVMF